MVDRRSSPWSRRRTFERWSTAIASPAPIVKPSTGHDAWKRSANAGNDAPEQTDATDA